jgi:hypothetical protein
VIVSTSILKLLLKQRHLLLAGRILIHLDRVKDLGDFFELDVVLKDGEDIEAGIAEAGIMLLITNWFLLRFVCMRNFGRHVSLTFYSSATTGSLVP